MSMLLALTLSVALTAQGSDVQPPADRVPAPINEEATYYFLMGRYFEGAGKVDEAVTAFKKAIQLDPKSAEPRAELAALYARQDKPREAVEAAEDALRVDPRNREGNRIIGSVLAALIEQRQPLKPGDNVSAYPKRAIAALEIARADGTGDLSIDLSLARLYLDQDRPADAVPLLRRIVGEQPQYAEGSVLLAEAQEAAGASDAAVETMTHLLEDQPQFFRGRVQLAEIYERQRRWAEAADAWASVQTLSQRNTEIASRRASALLNADRPADALGVLKDALKISPNDVRMSVMLAQAQRTSGDIEGAEATARSLQAAHPDDVRTTYLLAQLLEAKGRYQEMVDLLKPAIARLREASPPGEAADKAANKTPGKTLNKSGSGPVAMLLATEGLALQHLNRNDEAMAALKDATALAPDDTTVMFQLGALLDRAGRHAEAEKAFRDVIAKDPLDANALNYLGYMLAERGSTGLDEAVGLIQRALKVEPDNASYLDSLGWAYYQQGKIDLADQPLTAAADKMPKHSVVQDHLGDLRLKQRRFADAIAAWQRAIEGDGESVDRAKIQKKIDQARRQK
jgi:tetratricopeptide (TPR) repeat protein